jgi:translation initiation factor IF-3
MPKFYNKNRAPAVNRNYFAGPNRNMYIKAPEVRVIDNEGNNLGVLKTDEARKIAWEAELDLIEISPEANPPVCKIMDYSKYLYEQNKKKKRSRTKAREMKEFKFSPVIEQHDIDIKVKRAKEFLDKGHNVRITVERRGRQPREQALIIMASLKELFMDYDSIEGDSKEEGRRMMITYKKRK